MQLEEVRSKQAAYLGPESLNHPTLEYTMGQIANAAAKLNDYEKAMNAYEEVVRIKEAIYGPNFDGTLIPMLTLTSLLNVKKRDQEALELSKKAIGICEKLIAQPERAGNIVQVQSLMCEFLKLAYTNQG